MEENNAILLKAEEYVFQLFKEKLATHLIYHNFNHTNDVVEAAKLNAEGSSINEKDMELLLLAAWFHDTGFIIKSDGHEEESASLVIDFLEKENYDQGEIEKIKLAILSTKMPQNPKTKIEEILCDADLSNLGRKSYPEKSELLRIEWEGDGLQTYTNEDWLAFEIEFLTNHRFHTRFAQLKYNDQKIANIVRLKSKQKQKEDKSGLAEEKLKVKKEELQFKKQKSDLPERGIETMFRVTLRNHINLSAIADNKANIMLSINAIIISITISTLVPSFDTNPKLILPTGLLLLVCITTIIFATLSTRPKVTSGVFTKEDIKNKVSNLLFFGNFHDMSLKEFDWGMKEMMKDKAFLYGSMIKDFYYLGKVLSKKYRFLRICYFVFMYGLIIAVLTFVISFVF